MYRYSAMALGMLAVFVLAACTDTPTGSQNSPAAGAGTQGIGRFSDDEDVQQATEVPAAEKGVVPDLIGISTGDATTVVEEAGFEIEIEGGGVFGLTTDEGLLVCSQDPAAGDEPKKGSTVTVEGQKNGGEE